MKINSKTDYTTIEISHNISDKTTKQQKYSTKQIYATTQQRQRQIKSTAQRILVTIYNRFTTQPTQISLNTMEIRHKASL